MRRRAPRRPEWTRWANGLARKLQHVWEWLDGQSVARIAATLGGNLAPDAGYGAPWTVVDLVDVVEASRDRRPLLEAPVRPLKYLRSLIEALPDRYRRTGPATAAERYAAARAEQEAARERTRLARQRHAEATAAAVPAARSAGARQAREIARQAATSAVTAVRRRPAVPVRQPQPCAGGCHTTSTEVRIRHTPTPVPLCQGCWDAIQGR